ncbi:MAG: PAS domain S-box protein [Kiritimatiellae bacterium]|nr:PAS domain S-box protein [Kiritimatiellia bacterium]
MAACSALALRVAAGAEPNAVRTVLVLHSYHYGFTWTDSISAGIREVFSESGSKAVLRFEFMDTRRIHTPEYFEHFAHVLRIKYADAKPDVIICSDDHALTCMLEFTDPTFADVPLVFCSVSGFTPEMRRGREMTGLLESIDIKSTLDTALRLHPKTRNVVVITDKTQTGHALKAAARRVFADYPPPLSFRYVDDMVVEELVDAVAKLKEGSLVFQFIFSQDKAGRVFQHEENLRRIAARCRVPIYAVWDFYLGNGIVGGRLTSGRMEGQMVARMAIRILNGERASAIPLDMSPTQYMFDWNQLVRFGIRERDLPPDSRIVNKPFSIYHTYKNLIHGVAAVFLLLVGIVVLLLVVITQRRLAAARQARLIAILESTSDLVAMATPDERLIYMNRAGRKLLGWPLPGHPLAGKGLSDLHPARVLAVVREEGVPLAVRHGSWSAETAVLGPGGNEIPVSQVILAHKTPHGDLEFLSTIVRDISERKQAEAEAERQRQQLIQADKMIALGTLVSGVAHEINNPAHFIMLNAPTLRKMFRLFTQTLEEQGVLTDETEVGGHTYASLRDAVPRLLDGILDGARRIRNIVDDLKNFARYEPAGSRRPVDVNDVVRNAITLLDHQIRASTDHFSVDCGADLPKTLGNAQQIGQVVVNLLQNACQALPDRTRAIDVRTRLTEDGQHIGVTVKDEGEGIAAEHLPRVQDPFFTTKGGQGGTGLGLSVSASIAKAHGGTLRFASTPGAGTTAQLILPVRKRAENP